MRRFHGRSRRDGQLGQGMVELALILPLLLTILLGTIDLGRAFYSYISLTNAAREAARYAAVNDTAASATQVRQEYYVGSTNVSGCVPGTMTFSDSGGGRGNPYTVQVSCKFQLMTPFMARVLGSGRADLSTNRITIGSSATFVWD